VPTLQKIKETQQHFLSCTDTTSAWNDTIQANQPTCIRLRENKSLLRILLWATTTNSTNNKTLPQYLVIPQYEQLITEQTAIGWSQVIKGRLSTEWVRHLEKANPNKGEEEATDIITSLWKSVLTNWKRQCDVQHQKNQNQTNIITQHLTTQVEAIYLKKANLDIIDQQVLDQTIHSTLNFPVTALRECIKHTGSFVKQGLIRAKTRLKAQNHAITNFFLPLTRQQPIPSTCNNTAAQTTHNPAEHTTNQPDPNAKENMRSP
jgi:hypothetical protein